MFFNFSDEEGENWDVNSQALQQGDGPTINSSGNPFLDVPNATGATEFKKGYVMRKCCFDACGKKSNLLIFQNFNFLKE